MYKAKKLYWIVQFLGWGLFCLLLFLSRRYIGDSGFIMVIQVTELFILLVALTHCIRYLLIKYDWINLKMKKMVPLSVFLCYGSSVFLLTFTYLTSSIYSESNVEKVMEFFINTWLYTIFFAFWMAVYLAYHVVHKARIQELEKVQLLASHREIELKNLREQLNPHFLFNSLNSIRALISINPGTAKNAVTNLSNLLRSSLKMGEKPLVELDEEIELVENYLLLEKIRFEERLSYTINHDASGSIKIPPFIIQTLVENAIKHGISKQVNGGEVIIKTISDERILTITVINTGQLNTAYESPTGIGIENVKKRLSIQYEKNTNFELQEKEGKIIATVIVEL